LTILPVEVALIRAKRYNEAENRFSQLFCESTWKPRTNRPLLYCKNRALFSEQPAA